MAAIDRYLEKELKESLKEVSNKYPEFCKKCECNPANRCEFCNMEKGIPTGYFVRIR